MTSPIPPPGKYCHRTGFRSKCQTLVTKGHCQGRWTNVQGTHPQTGLDVDCWGCVDDHAALLGVEHSRKLWGIQAAVESMRNEVVKLQVEQIARQERQHREAMTFVPPASALPIENAATDHATHALTHAPEHDGHGETH